MRALLFLVGFVFALSAQAAPLALTGTHQSLAGHLAVAVDAEGRLDIDAMAAPAPPLEFHDLPGNLNLGFTGAAVWLRFTLLRPADAPREWWLEVQPSYIDHLTLYVPRADGGFEVRRNGHLDPLPRAELKYRNAVFRLDLPAGQAQTFYVRIASVHTMFAALDVWQPQAFAEAATLGHFGWGIFAGMALAMILSSIWFWAVTRDLEYFLLAAYAFFALLTMMCTGGHVLPWLPPQLQSWHDAVIGISLALAVALAAHFVNRFTRLAHHLPRVERAFTLSVWAVALYGCAGFVLGRFAQTMPTVQFSILLVSLLNTLLTIWLAWRRQPQAATMVFAMLSFWLVVPLRMMQTLGWIPREFGSDAMLNLSVLLYLVVLNFAGHQRYLQIRRENEAAQARALDDAQQAALVLENKVAERTHDLSAALVQVERARELEQAVHREQRQFVATMSHELRTPLAVIDATTQNLVRLSGDSLNAEGRVRLEKIQAAADRLTAIVDECLTPERIGMLEGAPNLRSEPLCEMLADAARAAQMFSEAHRVVVDCPAGVTAWCDPELFRLVLRTLADNAVKYTPAGATVSLRATVDAAGAVVVEVADDGPGIAADELPHVFERYFRGRAAVAHHGTGLGLPLARHVVTQIGGTIDVASAPGRGTTFTVRLPAAPA